MARPLSHLRSTPPLDPRPFIPTAQQPLLAKSRLLTARTHVLPHRHHWAQIVFSSRGVTQITTSSEAFVLPPKRAVWIPSGMEHAATVLEDSDLHSVYVLQPPGIAGPSTTRRSAQDNAWFKCRVLEVSPLLLELVRQLAAESPCSVDADRYRNMCMLTLSEVRECRALPLGIVLPQDKRLRSFCETFLHGPVREQSLESLARASGASFSTISRLFRKEIGTSFSSWRQQVVLARALALAVQRKPVSHIAIELGYSSTSAFSVMFRRLTGMPLSKYLSQREGELDIG